MKSLLIVPLLFSSIALAHEGQHEPPESEKATPGACYTYECYKKREEEKGILGRATERGVQEAEQRAEWYVDNKINEAINKVFSKLP